MQKSCFSIGVSCNFRSYFLLGNRCSNDYPYAFMWGEYCCKTELEENNNFVACDGGPISINSVCCKDNEYEKCPHIGGCKNNRGMNVCQKRVSIKYRSMNY